MDGVHHRIADRHISPFVPNLITFMPEALKPRPGTLQ